MALVRAAALSLTMARMVTAGYAIGDGFEGFDSGRNVIFGNAKDKTNDVLDGFSSGGVGDKEQNP